jgi:Uma2 family endonuclease
MVHLQIKQIAVPPGGKVFLTDLDWKTWEAILSEWGENRSSRLAYDQGTLEIVTPLPEHEINKNFITNFIEILLEELDIEFCPLGSTTFKNELMQQGIEPDNCFYIQHESLIRGKERIDLKIDPPPDLALEIDLTSRSHPEIYATLGVPELWQLKQGELQIKILEEGTYQNSNKSAIFPQFPLTDAIPDFLRQCKIQGRNRTMKQFRHWVIALRAGEREKGKGKRF